jgi:ATP-dependent Clp protease protease subunit
MNYAKEFKNYATNHLGIHQQQFDNWAVIQNKLYGSDASLTPYILEERELRVTQMDIFSRMLMDRILWVSGPVNSQMSTVVQAQLMFLDNVEKKDIIMHVDSPGGSVTNGLSIVDVMDYVSSDIITINTGMAASMGSVLLGSGTKGKRYSLRFSRVMLHQVSSGAEGTIADMRISINEAEKFNDVLFDLLGSYTGKTSKQVKKDADRDLWLNAEESLKYGIIDGIIKSKKDIKINQIS